MSRVLVTGGSGFLGSALCNRMADEGHEVAVFDNCSRGTGNLVNPARFEICPPDRADITHELDGCTDLSGFVGGYAYNSDTLFHLAAINGTKNFYERPEDVLRVQIDGTRNAIRACLAHDIKTLVLFSSSEVYQTAPVIPTPEDVPFTIQDASNPRYSYAIGKIAAEAMVRHSPIEKVVICRPHNVFGPNMGFDHVIPQFIMRAARTPDRGTFGIHGSTTRSFIYIDDFTDAMMAIWKNVNEREGRVREVFHVGTEEQVSTVALAGMISDIMGRKNAGPNRDMCAYKFKTHPAPAGGTPSRCPAIGKVRSLGWEPRVSLRDGLERTVAAYRAVADKWPAEGA